MRIQPGSTILFQGDSTTDCGRSRSNLQDLGPGYPAMVAAQLQLKYPGYGLRFVNRGVSGDKAASLRRRWQEDCLDLKPDFVSIMIGINDTWHFYDRGEFVSVSSYIEDCRWLMEQTLATGAQLLMMEPFVLPVMEDKLCFREDLDPRIDALRTLCREYHLPYIPLDGLFHAASMEVPPSHWTPDGVHPSPAGHAFIAREWLRTAES